MANFIQKIFSKSIDEAVDRKFNAQLEKRSIAISDTSGMMRILNLSTSGVNVNEQTVLGITALFRGVKIRCNMLATIPRQVYTRQKDGSAQADHTHPVAVMLKYMPDGNYSSFDFWHLMEFNAIMRGAGGAEIIRDVNGRAVSLRIFRFGATWYQPFHADRPLIYDNETMRAYDLSEVIYLPGLTVNDGVRNYTLMNLFRDTFGEDLAAQLLRHNFQKQGPHLGGVYTFTGNLRDLQKADLANDLIKDFGGTENAGKILPISQAENFKQFEPMNLANAQTVDLAKLRVEDASRITGVPLSLLASIEKTSYNSMSELFQQWKITELDPRFTQLDEELNRKLIRTAELGRTYIETVIDELMWSTPKERAEYWRELIKSGLMLPNEGREYLNRPAVEGGDVALIEANNLQPLALVAEGATLKNANPNPSDNAQRKDTSKGRTPNGVAVHPN